jgi:rod shape determining protein RodA
MLNRLKLYLKNLDWLIFAVIFLLIAFGLVEIYSIALGQNTLDLLNFRKQIFFASAGLILFFIFSFIDSRFLKSISRYLYFLALAVLIAVLLFGSTIRGTTGWFSIFGFGIQPVEFVKVILILFLADFFSRVAMKTRSRRYFILSALIAGALILMVSLQPDFGSTVILGLIWLVMIAAAGFEKKYLLIIGAAALIIFSVSWFLLFKDYQKDRIIDFIRPGENALESGYHASQAMIAVGSGGLTGKGVGFGSQSQLRFLPEAQNDFIFAVISEELGFLGVLLVLGFFTVFFGRCFLAMRKIKDDFGIYFIIGGGSLIFIQMFINIGMNLGILPIVGLSLPFVSYGGSSLLSLLILTGMMENIIIKSKISY